MLLTYPLMVAIQEISARVGRVTGHGIAGNVCRNFPAPVMWSLIILLFVANTINVAADLGAMGDALRLLIGGPNILYVAIFGYASVVAQIFLNYRRYVAILKWLTLTLFAYVIALVVVKVSWSDALLGLVVPHIRWDSTFLTTLVALLGTTISPYLFIWQSSQEAEEQRIDPHKKPLRQTPSQSSGEFARIRVDTLVGMAFSNIIGLAIIITRLAIFAAFRRASRARARRGAADDRAVLLADRAMTGTVLAFGPPEPPKDFNGDAAGKWRETWRRLDHTRFEMVRDRNLLVGYCEEYGNWREAKRNIAKLSDSRYWKGCRHD